MKMYLNGNKGKVLFYIDGNALRVAFSSDYGGEAIILNLQENEILPTTNTIEINEVIIKNHGDYQGTVDSLVSANVIFGNPVRFIELGYVKYGVYCLTPGAVKEIYNQNKVKIAV